jgi:hypothetical protein
MSAYAVTLGVRTVRTAISAWRVRLAPMTRMGIRTKTTLSDTACASRAQVTFCSLVAAN